MSRGGKRKNAGRPIGSLASHTIVAQTFRKRLIERVLEEQDPIIESLIKQAKQGQIQALKEVMERVLGKVTTTMEIENKVGSNGVLTDAQKSKLDALLSHEK